MGSVLEGSFIRTPPRRGSSAVFPCSSLSLGGFLLYEPLACIVGQVSPAQQGPPGEHVTQARLQGLEKAPVVPPNLGLSEKRRVTEVLGLGPGR